MIVKIKDLKEIRKKHKDEKIVIGLGSFDLLHWEHLQFVNDCKKYGDIVVIAVKHNDAVGLKGYGRPIIDQQQRLELIDNLKSVDYTVLTAGKKNIKKFIHEYKLADKPEEIEWWQFFHEIFENLNPDVFVYQVDNYPQESRLKYLKEKNILGVEREYRGLITTTKIINKIKEILETK